MSATVRRGDCRGPGYRDHTASRHHTQGSSEQLNIPIMAEDDIVRFEDVYNRVDRQA